MREVSLGGPRVREADTRCYSIDYQCVNASEIIDSRFEADEALSRVPPPTLSQHSLHSMFSRVWRLLPFI